ncbi:hypothetical protein PRVXT_000547 [Proteinivorax tanatarense]|uniref:DUF3784 domain-containing protein n=1 Tax=Proteinivorax tanatarense TaxID=1260629 RepID=A0AAU7VMT9_9FIRM
MLEILQTSAVQIGIFILILVAIICNMIVKLTMVKSGIYKNYSKNKISAGRIQGGLWTLGIGLLAIAFIQLDNVGFWLGFWILIAMAGLIQIISALLGSRSKYF